MSAVPVEGEEKFPVGKGGALGELVPPACEPAFQEVEGVLEAGRRGALRGRLDHLCPDKGTETVALLLRGIRIAEAFPKVEQGAVPSDGVIGQPCPCSKAFDCACRECDVVADVWWGALVGGKAVPVLSEQLEVWAT